MSDPKPVKPIDIDPVVAPHPSGVESSASVLDDIIQYPNPPANKKGKSTSDMPKHLTGVSLL